MSIIEITIGIILFSAGFLAGFWINAFYTRRLLEEQIKRLQKECPS